MRRVLIILVAGACALGSAAAHHSFSAVYDPEQPVTVTGKVTGVEWMNPHARFFADVENDAGGVDNWVFELAAPNGLMRIGWRKDSLAIGETITVTGFRARNGSFAVNARSVRRPDGSGVFTGDPVQGGLQ